MARISYNLKNNNLLKKILFLLLQFTSLWTITLSADVKEINKDETNNIINEEGIKCQNKAESCSENYSCIRFNTAEEDNYTCELTTKAFCKDESYCSEVLGSNYKYCYLPPWDETNDVENRKQCFTVHSKGFSCLFDIHCAENLACVDNICSIKTKNNNANSNSLYDDFQEEETDSGEILGISKWIFYTAIGIPILIIVFCIWCWIIGSNSSKRIENRKKEKYESELKKLTIPPVNQAANGENKKSNKKDLTTIITMDPNVSAITTTTNANKKKSNNKANENNSEIYNAITTSTPVPKPSSVVSDLSSIDIALSKQGKSTGTGSAISSNVLKKKRNNKLNMNSSSATTTTSTPSSLSNSNTHPETASSTTPTPSSLSPATANKVVRKKQHIKSKQPKSIASNTSTTPNSTTKTTGTKGTKATTSTTTKKKSPSQSDTNNSNSSSQRGLMSSSGNASSAMSGQSASYFSGTPTTPMDATTALYYQQMYNAAAAAAAQNSYYNAAASYMQNPYYAQNPYATAANAANPAAASQTAQTSYYQDPNLMYKY